MAILYISGPSDKLFLSTSIIFMFIVMESCGFLQHLSNIVLLNRHCVYYKIKIRPTSLNRH
jgi:hypothetical protein